MNRTVINLLLLVVVIVLLLLVLYEPGIDTPAEPPQLLSLTADEVNEITINSRLQDRIVLKRTSTAAWQMVEPLQIAANRYKVESVLDILQQQPTNRFSVTEEKLESYGLHKPQVELIFDGLKREQRLIFGSQTPLNAYRYLQLGKEIVTCSDTQMPQTSQIQGCVGVVTIRDSAFYPIASLYTNFIASKLLPEGVQIAAIQLPDFRLSLGDSGWSVESQRGGLSVVEEISADQLAQWIEAWRYAGSVDIEPIDQSRAPAEFDEVVVSLQSGEELHWTILDQQDGLVLGRRDLGIEYHLSDPQRVKLLSPPPPPSLQDEREETL